MSILNLRVTIIKFGPASSLFCADVGLFGPLFVKSFSYLLLLLFSCSACQKIAQEFEPAIVYFPNPIMLASRPSAFAPLTPQECRSDWGKELRVGYRFSMEQDFYRAITAFKRALIFLPLSQKERKMQIEYDVFHAYYLAYKYQEAIEGYESSSLYCGMTVNFPACRDLLLQLYESYRHIGEDEKAAQTLTHIMSLFPEEGAHLKLSTAILDADFPAIATAAESQPNRSEVDAFLADYMLSAKSVERARLYQALIPGAGYYYVGQKQAAFTSFVINTLFIWAAYRFFEQGHIAAGLVTASLETGWYFGGINGAGLAAKEFNERLYHTSGRDLLRRRALFPILMIQTSF